MNFELSRCRKRAEGDSTVDDSATRRAIIASSSAYLLEELRRRRGGRVSDVDGGEKIGQRARQSIMELRERENGLWEFRTSERSARLAPFPLSRTPLGS